jgi:putative FmdB family regulatory protein
MPIYEYRCSRCHYRFETTHRVGETVDRCERCGGPVRRVFSPPALIFKGSGFHITDYRKTPAPSDGDGKASGSGKRAGESKGGTSSKAESGSKTKTSESGSGSTAASSAGDGKKAS